MNKTTKTVIAAVLMATLVVSVIGVLYVLPQLTTTTETVAPTAPESEPLAFSDATTSGTVSTQKQVNAGAEYVRMSLAAISGFANSAPDLAADGTTKYVFFTGVEYKANSTRHIVRQDIWINRLGTDENKPRGVVRWGSTRDGLLADTVKPRGEPITCACSNAGICAPNTRTNLSYAVIDDFEGSGSDYLGGLTSCTSWHNPTQGTNYSDGSANHVVLFELTLASKWAPDGPNQLNDIAMYAKNSAGLANGWFNHADKFNVPYVAPTAQCKDGIDNDDDGKIDCVTGNADPGCFPDGKGGGGSCSPDDTTEEDVTQCSDGIDNDGDLKIDCTEGSPDPGCFPDGKGGGGECSLTDNNESDTVTPQCSDGIDNDGDGKIDCVAGNEDPGCFPNQRGGGGSCDATDNRELDATVQWGNVCTETLTLSEPTATPTPTRVATATPTPTRVAATPTAIPTPTPTTAVLPEATAPTATPTVAVLPEAGLSLPTVGALGGGVVMILLGILLAL